MQNGSIILFYQTAAAVSRENSLESAIHGPKSGALLLGIKEFTLSRFVTLKPIEAERNSNIRGIQLEILNYDLYRANITHQRAAFDLGIRLAIFLMEGWCGLDPQ